MVFRLSLVLALSASSCLFPASQYPEPAPTAAQPAQHPPPTAQAPSYKEDCLRLISANAPQIDAKAKELVEQGYPEYVMRDSVAVDLFLDGIGCDLVRLGNTARIGGHYKGPDYLEVAKYVQDMAKKAVAKVLQNPDSVRMMNEGKQRDAKRDQEHKASLERIRKSQNPLKHLTSMDHALEVYPADYQMDDFARLSNLNSTTGKFLYLKCIKAIQSLRAGFALFKYEGFGSVILGGVPPAHPKFHDYAFNDSEATCYDILGESLGVTPYTTASGATRTALKVRIVYVSSPTGGAE